MELVTSLDSIDSSTQSFYIALAFKLTPQWHVYWKNSGDSGTPPSLEWKSKNSEISFSEILWPAPTRIPLAPLMSYGYEKEVLFPVEVTLKKPPRDDLKIALKASWLVCKVECVPESQHFEFTVPLKNKSQVSAQAEKIETFLDRQAKKVPQLRALLKKDATHFQLTIESSADRAFDDLEDAYFFSEEGLRVNHAAPQMITEKRATFIILSIERDVNDDDTKNSLSGILELKRANGVSQFIQLSTETTAPIAPFVANTFLLSLVFSFLGGLILNLMPCVFPVLFLKIYALTKNTSLTVSERKFEAWAYGAGVISSFLALAVVLLLLKSAGFAVGWGFQLQSPSFVALAFLLFVAMGLSLLGLFEVNTSLVGAGQSLTQKSGAKGSFFTGVLATLVATPCSAPFMGSAVGYALTRQSWEAFPIFIFLGAGLAFPYILLAYFPKLLKWIPKPGLWMEHLKQFFGFGLLGTALWLLWIFGTQQNTEAVIAAFAAALFLAFGLWTLRLKHKFLKYFLIGLSAIGALSFYKASISSANFKTQQNTEVEWESFGVEKLESYLSQNKAVFIDFTASWCLTCQVNKKLVLNTSEATQFFKDNNVIRIRADWTNYDAAITQALSKLGRQSVPVYAYYAPGKKTPVLLPELLSLNILTTTIINQNKED